MTGPGEVSPHQIESEWAAARQMLNDSGITVPLPMAVERLLMCAPDPGRYPTAASSVVDLAEARSRRVHPSSRRRADLTVAPEVTP